jgi:hypothetical protein
MTAINVPQNGATENANPQQTAYILHLTRHEWREHWHMLLMGATLAEGLLFFPKLGLPRDLSALDPHIRLIVELYLGQYNHLRGIAEHGYEITDRLEVVYNRAIEVGEKTME